MLRRSRPKADRNSGDAKRHCIDCVSLSQTHNVAKLPTVLKVLFNTLSSRIEYPHRRHPLDNTKRENVTPQVRCTADLACT